MAGLPSVNLGVCIVPEGDWRDVLSRWREAEQAGFRTGWSYDNVVWRDRPGSDFLAMVPLLAAVAVTTSRLRLGPIVASPNIRHPAAWAKDLVTLDRLSSGRIEVGLGAGDDGGGKPGTDASLLGGTILAAPQRTDRFAEFVEIVHSLLNEPSTTLTGRHYKVRELRLRPEPVQRTVPLTVVATGPRGLGIAARRAARWATAGPAAPTRITPEAWYARLAAQCGQFERACRAEGVPAADRARMLLVPLELSWAQCSRAAWTDFLGNVTGLGFTEVVVHWPRPADKALAGPAPDVFEHIMSGLPEPGPTATRIPHGY